MPCGEEGEEVVDGCFSLLESVLFVPANPVDAVGACCVVFDTSGCLFYLVISRVMGQVSSTTSCRRFERGEGWHLSFLCLETQHSHNPNIDELILALSKD